MGVEARVLLLQIRDQLRRARHFCGRHAVQIFPVRDSILTVDDLLETTLPVRRVVRATVPGEGLLEIADGRIDRGDRVDVELIFLTGIDAVSREPPGTDGRIPRPGRS